MGTIHIQTTTVRDPVLRKRVIEQNNRYPPRSQERARTCTYIQVHTHKFSFMSDSRLGGYGSFHFHATYFWKIYFFNRVLMCGCLQRHWILLELEFQAIETKLQNQYIFLTIEPSAQLQCFYFLQYFWFCWRDWGRLTVLTCHSFPLAALLYSVFFLQYLFPSCVCCVVLGIEHRALHLPYKYLANRTQV